MRYQMTYVSPIWLSVASSLALAGCTVEGSPAPRSGEGAKRTPDAGPPAPKPDAHDATDKEGDLAPDEPYILDEDYWSDEEGDIAFDQADPETWKLVNDVENDDSTEEFNVYVGEDRNADPDSRDVIVNYNDTPITTFAGTYVTLADGRVPKSVPVLGGSYWAIKGGVQFNIAALSASIDITLQVGAGSLTLWGWELSYGKDRGLCTDVSPGKFPLTLDLCANVTWSGTDRIGFGGSLDLCTPPGNPCGAINCQYCLGGVGLGGSVRVPAEIRDKL